MNLHVNGKAGGNSPVSGGTTPDPPKRRVHMGENSKVVDQAIDPRQPGLRHSTARRGDGARTRTVYAYFRKSFLGTRALIRTLRRPGPPGPGFRMDSRIQDRREGRRSNPRRLTSNTGSGSSYARPSSGAFMSSCLMTFRYSSFRRIV